jgi:hypothetical protein
MFTVSDEITVKTISVISKGKTKELTNWRTNGCRKAINVSET